MWTKLQAYGVRGTACSLVGSYCPTLIIFTLQRQITYLLLITVGDYQGIVLSPDLNNFINDLSQVELQSVRFTDDAVLYAQSDNFVQAVVLINLSY